MSRHSRGKTETIMLWQLFGEVTHINPEAACRRNFHLKSKATSALKVHQVTTLVPETRVKIQAEG